MIDLRKIMPANLRTVQRYTDLINAYQTYLYQDVKPQIDLFEERLNFDSIGVDDIPKILFDYGHVLSQGAGYTATERYLRKELQTMIKRLRAKGAEPSYKYLFYVFEVMGDVYPLIYKPDGSLEPFLTWLTSDENDPPPLQLDTSLTLDQNPYEFSYPYWTLDWGAFTSATTRHFLISYSPEFIENATEFMSTTTAIAFSNDVEQNKRKIEIPHYEFRLYAAANADTTLTTEVWNNYENTISANQYSIRITNSLSLQNAAYIQFGNGAHSPVNNSITSVQSLIQQIPLSSMLIKQKTSTQLYFKNVIYPTTRLFDYREICVLDASMNPIFYSTFPWVRYNPSTYYHGYFFLSLI